MTRFEDFADRWLDIKSWNGVEAYAICPFHKDTSPSFAFNTANGLWLCHACGVKGNADQLAEQLGTSVSASVESLKAKLQALDELTEQVEEIKVYPEAWLAQFNRHHDYWEERGIGKQTREAFGLGFDPFTNAVTIPLRDASGALLGVVRRRLDKGGPKYLYPRGFKAANNLFGSWMINEESKIAIVEGPIDALACWDSGVPAVALYGSRISKEQVRLIADLQISTIVIMTDNDAAGQKAAEDIVANLSGVFWHLPPTWPDGANDPGEIDRDTLQSMYEQSLPYWRLN